MPENFSPTITLKKKVKKKEKKQNTSPCHCFRKKKKKKITDARLLCKKKGREATLSEEKEIRDRSSWNIQVKVGGRPTKITNEAFSAHSWGPAEEGHGKSDFSNHLRKKSIRCKKGRRGEKDWYGVRTRVVRGWGGPTQPCGQETEEKKEQ